MSLDRKKRKLTLLICDDFEVNRDILRNLLGDEFNYKEAADGNWCIMELERSHEDIDILILDLVMPNINGLKVLEWLQEQPWPHKPLVIVMSTEDNNDIIAQAFQLGASDYISRPANSVVIKNRMKKLLESMQLRRELQYNATHDAMTGLLEHSCMLKRIKGILGHKLSAEDEYAMVMVDLDYFKNINDTRGWEFGDMILKEVAARIRTVLNPGDMAARLGGNEFIIFVRLMETPESFADRLHKVLTFNFQGQHITTSIGVVECGGAVELEELFAKASDAMYFAKKRGRNQVAVYDDSMELRKSRKQLNVVNGELPVALIVEDNVLDAKILKHILGKNYTTLIVEDGYAAQQQIIASGDGIDLVLLDLEMPRLNGLGFLDWMRESDLLKDMPVIVCTSNNSVDMEVDCLRRGASGFITKPVHKEIAENRIMSCMRLWNTVVVKR